MEKYPRIGGKRERKTNTTAKCPCGAVGKWMIDIQTSPFRGEDDTEWRCGEHKDCIDVETELARKDAEIASLMEQKRILDGVILRTDAKLKALRRKIGEWAKTLRGISEIDMLNGSEDEQRVMDEMREEAEK